MTINNTLIIHLENEIKTYNDKIRTAIAMIKESNNIVRSREIANMITMYCMCIDQLRKQQHILNME